MSAAHASCRSSGSTDRPITFTPRLSNSGLIFAMYPSSVVQIGVKSFGCENSTPHESPSQSWKLIFPSVVSAGKSGAGAVDDRPMSKLLCVESLWQIDEEYFAPGLFAERHTLGGCSGAPLISCFGRSLHG